MQTAAVVANSDRLKWRLNLVDCDRRKHFRTGNALYFALLNRHVTVELSIFKCLGHSLVLLLGGTILAPVALVAVL
jgi:hypothetical protein